MDISDAVDTLEKASVKDLQKYSRDLRDIVSQLGDPIPYSQILGKHIVSVKTTGEDNLDHLIEHGGSGNYSFDVEREVLLDNDWTITVKIDGSVELFKTNNYTEKEWDYCNMDMVLTTSEGRYADVGDIIITLYNMIEKSGSNTFMGIFEDLCDLINDCTSITTFDEIELILDEEAEKLRDYLCYNSDLFC